MSHQREELLAKIKQQFSVVVASQTFGEHTFDFCRPTDPEAILDEQTLLAPHGEMDWQPYWAQAWDAAIGISTHLSQLNLLDTTLLDLGCGLGITSAVAVAQGARVLSGDNAPPALLFTEWNCWPWRDRSRVQLIDWRTTQLDERFEMIVGSDILYDRSEIPYLNQFWKSHLRPGGRILLGDPTRPMTGEFLDQLIALDWHMKTTELKCNGIPRPVRIVELTWPQN